MDLQHVYTWDVIYSLAVMNECCDVRMLDSQAEKEKNILSTINM